MTSSALSHHLILWTAMIAGATSGCRRDDRTAGDSAKAGRDEAIERKWEIQKPAPATAQVSDTSLPVPAQPTAVKRGRLPLVYLVETEAPIVVTNDSTETRLAQATVPARTIVRIDAQGVFFGRQRVAPGPLAADDSYGIWIEPASGSTVRRGSMAPSPSPAREQRNGGAHD